MKHLTIYTIKLKDDTITTVVAATEREALIKTKDCFAVVIFEN